MSNLLMVEFTLSNGLVFTVPKKYVLALNFDKVSESVVYKNRATDGVVKYKIARLVEFELDEGANKLAFIDENFQAEKRLPFDYFQTEQGLTTIITLYYEDGKSEEYHVVWHKPYAITNNYEKVTNNNDSIFVSIKKRKTK